MLKRGVRALKRNEGGVTSWWSDPFSIGDTFETIGFIVSLAWKLRYNKYGTDVCVLFSVMAKELR